MLDDLGSPKTYNHYPNGWAMAFNTPFKMWKRYEFNGGTSDPCIISWPAGMKARGEIRDQYHHAIDIVPTILDVLGVERAERDQGPRPEPVRRRQHALQPRRREGGDDAADAVLRHARLPGDLARRLEGRDARIPTISGWSNFNDDEWELYNTAVDRSELHNLADEHPEKVRELVNLWFAEAGANGAFPLDDRSALEIMTHAAAGPRSRRATATSTSRARPRCRSRRR